MPYTTAPSPIVPSFSVRDLMQTEEYWLTSLQCDLFEAVDAFRKGQGLTVPQLAERLGLSLYATRRLLAGDFNGRVSELVRLALAVGVTPYLTLPPLNEYLDSQLVSRPATTTL